MRFYLLTVLIALLGACNNKENKKNKSDETTQFELVSVVSSIYDSLTLAPGIQAEVLAELPWPAAIIQYKNGLIIGQNPHRLAGDINENSGNDNPLIHYYNLPKNEQIDETKIGFQTAFCHAPWGGILIATTGKKRYDKGYIYHLKDGILTRLDALGTSSFWGVAATQTKDGRAVIYYSDCTQKMSSLLKFVADSGIDCSKGEIYGAKIPNDGWVSLNRNKNPSLSNAYKTQNEVLANLNDATKVVGLLKRDVVTFMEFDKSDGTLKYTVLPQLNKGYFYGAINYIFEDGGMFEGTAFHFKPYLLAGLKDNYSHLASFTIDDKNGIWICTGMSKEDIGADNYKTLGGNALLLMPKTGVQSNLLLRLAVAPKTGRFSGIVLNKKQKCVYTTLQDQEGTGQLIKLTGEAIEKLLE